MTLASFPCKQLNFPQMKPDTPSTGTRSRGICRFPSKLGLFRSQRLHLSGFPLPLPTEVAHRAHWRLLNQNKYHRASPSVLYASLPPGRSSCPFHQPIGVPGFLFQTKPRTQFICTSQSEESRFFVNDKTRLNLHLQPIAQYSQMITLK